MIYETYDESDSPSNSSPPPKRRKINVDFNKVNNNNQNKVQRQYEDDFEDFNSRPHKKNYLPFGFISKNIILILHLILISGAIFLIYVIFVSPFLFQDQNNFKLTGELSNFSTELNQTLRITIQDYNLDLDGRTRLEGTGETFTLINFSGTLTLENKSMKLSGKTPLIQTRSSTINALEQQIVIEFEKGGVELQLEKINMKISDRLDITYSPDLVYSTGQPTFVEIYNFTGTFSHDSMIGLYGKVNSFSVKNENSNIKFS